MNTTKLVSSVMLSLLLGLVLAGCGKGGGGPSDAEIEKYAVEHKSQWLGSGGKDMKIIVVERGEAQEIIQNPTIPKGTILYPVIFMATGSGISDADGVDVGAYPVELYFYQDQYGDWQAREPNRVGASHSARYSSYMFEYWRKANAVDAEREAIQKAAREAQEKAAKQEAERESKIKGAFGVNLGDIYDPKKVIPLSEDEQAATSKMIGSRTWIEVHDGVKDYRSADPVNFPDGRQFPKIGWFMNFESDGVAVFFKPNNAVSPFQYYAVSYTPKSKRIYAIQAVAMDEEARSSNKKSERLSTDAMSIINALRAKYNAPDAFERSGASYEKEYRDVNRVIYIMDNQIFYLGIGYYDASLMELANKEENDLREEKRIEEERQKESGREQERGKINAGGL